MLVKICGMINQKTLNLAEELGFNLCGFIFYPPSPRNLTPEQAAGLKTSSMLRTGVFVDQDAERILHIAQIASLDLFQLHGSQSAEEAAKLPRDKVIRVLWPGKHTSAAALQRTIDSFADTCGFYLLDAGMGSGKILDWKGLSSLHFPHPWFLSGGIGPENAAEALSILHPDGLDLNSRLESSPGKKDPHKMRQALSSIRSLQS
ncbi:MAG: phosphoribosylanthranilate isomerase [Desulfovibrionaceae bacterium]|nr:phosphoribosylanthranilate isomerase [Desulfovibrionaceae bacterium]